MEFDIIGLPRGMARRAVTVPITFYTTFTLTRFKPQFSVVRREQQMFAEDREGTV